MRILLCTLLKVVSHYGLSVVHIGNGFPKNLDAGGWVGGVSSIHFFGFLEFLQPCPAPYLELWTVRS